MQTWSPEEDLHVFIPDLARWYRRPVGCVTGWEHFSSLPSRLVTLTAVRAATGNIYDSKSDQSCIIFTQVDTFFILQLTEPFELRHESECSMLLCVTLVVCALYVILLYICMILFSYCIYFGFSHVFDAPSNSTTGSSNLIWDHFFKI